MAEETVEPVAEFSILLFPVVHPQVGQALDYQFKLEGDLENLAAVFAWESKYNGKLRQVVSRAAQIRLELDRTGY